MWILLPIASFVLAVTVHGLVMRIPVRIDSVRRFLMVGIPTGLALIAVSFGSLGVTKTAFAAILLYALMCELYMFIFTLVISSVSATMLIMLRRGPIEERSVTSVYEPEEMVRTRLNRLRDNGFVETVNGRLSVSGKGLKLHRAFASLRRFFGHDSG